LSNSRVTDAESLDARNRTSTRTNDIPEENRTRFALSSCSAFLLMNISYSSLFPISAPLPCRYIVISSGFSKQPDESAGDGRILCAAGATFAMLAAAAGPRLPRSF
jgi:hypothetical protein